MILTMDQGIDPRRLAAIEARLTAVEQMLGISRASVMLSDGSMLPSPAPEVIELITAGQVLPAIAAYRSQTNATIGQAREVLEGIRQR
jgi:hypothetical protein